MHRLMFIFTLIVTLGACGVAVAQTTGNASQSELANPASENCVKEGGTLTMATDGSGGQYGVCLFEDNRQCEEWALMRGECPKGGVKVTGYVTDAGRYCAIRGGSYSVTVEASGDQPEMGDCTLPNGTTCSAEAYYDGTCPKG